MQEITIYKDDWITVTNVRAIFSLTSTTYPLQNITSVRASTVKKSRTPLIWGIIGLLVAAIVGLGGSPWALVFGVAGAFGVLFFFLMKDRHFVRIGTAGTEQDALWVHDLAYVQRVVAALNDAIVQRSVGR